MTRRGNRLLWFAFASIPLAPLVIVLSVALNPGTNQAQRQMKKIQLGMTIEQVRAAIGVESRMERKPKIASMDIEGEWAEAEWCFRDGSKLMITFFGSLVIHSHQTTLKRAAHGD